MPDSSSKAAVNGGYMFFEFRSGKFLIAACAVMSVFTDTFLYGLVLPVFPFSLQQRSGVPKEDVQQVLSLLVGICGAGVLVGAPLCGWISEVASTRRLPLLLGFIFLLVSTAIIRFGTAVWVLVCGRFFTGMAACLTWTVGQSLLADRVDERESGRYLSLMGVGGNIGMFMGPVVGGAIYARAGYNAVFDMALGLLVFDIVLRTIIIEPKTLRAVIEARNSPPASNGPSGNGDTERSPLLANGHDQQASSSSDQPTTERTPEQTSPLRVCLALFSSARFNCACFSMLLGTALFTTLEATLPLFANEEFGYGPAETAALFTTIVIPSFCGPFFGWIRDKTQAPRTIITLSFVVVTPIIFGMGFVQKTTLMNIVEVLRSTPLDADAQKRVGILATLLVLIGFTGTARSSSVSAEFPASVRDLERVGRMRGGGEGVGMAYSICGIMYAFGSLIGPFIGGALKDHFGWRYLCFAMASMTAVGALVEGFMSKHQPVPLRDVGDTAEYESDRASGRSNSDV